MGLLVITVGPMFSGKTDWLVDRFDEASAQGIELIAVRPAIDSRTPVGQIRSHSGRTIPAASVASDSDFAGIPLGTLVVADEIQFLSQPMIAALIRHASEGAGVVAAGLDYDFARRPFEVTTALIEAADEVVVRTATCTRCGGGAGFTQRFANGVPAPLDADRIVVGDETTYQPRCESCWLEERP